MGPGCCVFPSMALSVHVVHERLPALCVHKLRQYLEEVFRLFAVTLQSCVLSSVEANRCLHHCIAICDPRQTLDFCYRVAGRVNNLSDPLDLSGGPSAVDAVSLRVATHRPGPSVFG